MKLQRNGYGSRINRRLTQVSVKKRTPRVVTFTSGKEGVGQTSILINLGLALRQMAYRVLLIDGAVGGARLGTLLGLEAKPNLGDFFRGRKKLAEILTDGPLGLKVLPGVPELTGPGSLNLDQKLGFLEGVDQLAPGFDYILVDSGTGVSNQVLYFNLGATHRIIVVDHEATSLVEAYSMVKFLAGCQAGKRFQFLFNKISQPQLAEAAFSQLTRIADRFLNGAVFMEYLGCIPFDRAIPAAEAEMCPLLALYPNSPAGLAFLDLARQLDLQAPQNPDCGSIHFGRPKRHHRAAC